MLTDEGGVICRPGAQISRVAAPARPHGWRFHRWTSNSAITVRVASAASSNVDATVALTQPATPGAVRPRPRRGAGLCQHGGSYCRCRQPGQQRPASLVVGAELAPRSNQGPAPAANSPTAPIPPTTSAGAISARKPLGASVDNARSGCPHRSSGTRSGARVKVTARMTAPPFAP